MTVRLRPYQTEAITAILSDWQRYSDVLAVLATGSGKTIIFLSLLLDHVLTNGASNGRSHRGLILAHRRELIDQPLERIATMWPDWALQTGVVMADQDECDKSLTIASVQTVVNPDRLARVLEHGAINYVITDECHHGTADSYLSIYDQLRAANPNLRHLGVTATPLRTDNDGLKKVFKKVSYKAGIKELIKLGHLVPFKALGVRTGISLKTVKLSDGDFVAKQLADVWECDNLYDLIVESHQKYAGDRPSMVFTVSVEGAHRLAEQFNAAGIPAGAADGSTAKIERRAIVGDFKAGRLQVLCNCALWTEGLDLPKIACIHMARPTKSDLVYVQAMGRGLRPFPGKEDCLVLDYCPVDARNVIMAGDLLGKPRQQKELEEKAGKAGVIVQGFSFTGEGNGVDGDPDELVTRPLNYLSASPFAWYFDRGLSTLGLGNNGSGKSGTLVISGNELLLIEREIGSSWDNIRRLAQGEFEKLAELGAEYAEEHGAAVLIGKNKSWQGSPASEKQVALLAKLMPRANGNSKLRNLTKGAAAKLLTSEFARRSLAKAGWRVG